MKRAWLVLLCTGFSACINFDDELRAWCADAGPGVCDVLNNDAGPGDAGAATDAGNDAGADEDAGFDAGPGDDDAGVDGGADAGESDAGQPDAGSPDAGSADAGFIDAGAPICLSQWCWQNPAFPPTTLHAVWGSADDDVYVAGTGGMVFHYDGHTWALAKLISEALPRWSVVTSGAATSTGPNWVCGPDVGARSFMGPAGAVIGESPSCASVAQYGDRLAFVDSAVDVNARIGTSYSSATPFFVNTHDAGSTRRDQIGLGANDEWAVIDQSNGPDQWVITPQRAAPGVWGAEMFDYSFQPQALRPGPGGALHLLATGTTSVRAQHDAGMWHSVKTVPISAHADMFFHDDAWWYSSGGHVYYEAPDGGLVLVAQEPDAFTDSLWGATGTSLWMASSNGQVFKITGTTSNDVVRMTGPVQPKIYDVVVKGPPETWRAFGEGGATWQHAAGRWSLQPGSGAAVDTVLAADWLPDAGHFRLHRDGRVVFPGGLSRNIGTGTIAPLSGFERPHGALVASGNTEVWAAAGNRLARVLVDGGVAYVAFSTTLPMSHATGLVVSETAPEQHLVHVSMANDVAGALTDGGVLSFSIVANVLNDGGFIVGPGEPVYSIERSVSGLSYALTASSLVECDDAQSPSCSVCTFFPSVSEMGSPESDAYQDLYPMSLSVTPNRVALLDSYGRVYDEPVSGACDATPLVPAALPWPRGKNVSGMPLPMRIKRNGTQLFVVGERGAILSRPNP